MNLRQIHDLDFHDKFSLNLQWTDCLWNFFYHYILFISCFITGTHCLLIFIKYYISLNNVNKKIWKENMITTPQVILSSLHVCLLFHVFVKFFVIFRNSFFYLGFLSRTFTIHRTTGMGEAVSLTSLCHFHPLHRHLDIKLGDHCKELNSEHS